MQRNRAHLHAFDRPVFVGDQFAHDHITIAGDLHGVGGGHIQGDRLANIIRRDGAREVEGIVELFVLDPAERDTDTDGCHFCVLST